MKNRIVVAAVAAALFAGNAQSAELIEKGLIGERISTRKKCIAMATIDGGSALLVGLVTTMILKKKGQSFCRTLRTRKLAVGSSMLIAAGLAHIAAIHVLQTMLDLKGAEEFKEIVNKANTEGTEHIAKFKKLPTPFNYLAKWEQSKIKDPLDRLNKMIKQLPTPLDFFKPWKVFEGERFGAVTPEELAPRSWETRLEDIALWEYTIDLEPTDNGNDEGETY
ncbi:hypothetical protein HOD08_02370 [bacterium]|jgi:hypothetical protein|nr:hypothetical protein [bacterium]